MSAFHPTRSEVQAVQRLARLCEAFAVDAARCQTKGMPGAWLACDSLAREYASRAFDLSAAVAARSQA